LPCCGVEEIAGTWKSLNVAYSLKCELCMVPQFISSFEEQQGLKRKIFIGKHG
jgi:hypothetical protein